MFRYDFVDLKVFVHIAQMRSFRLGAEQCFMTVSAASVRIKQLEETFKTKLFIRKAREVELTQAGERFLANARMILLQTQHMESDMARFSGRENDTIRLQTTYSALSGRLKDDIGPFLKAHPDINVDFTISRSPEIAHAIQEGQADIGVINYTEDIEGLSFTPYFKCSYVLLVDHANPRLRRLHNSISLMELKDFPLIALDKDSTIQQYLEEQAKAVGIKLNIRARFPSLHAGLSAMHVLEAGMFAPEHSSVAKIPGIKKLAIAELWNHQDLRICVPQDQQRISPITRELLTHLLSTAQHHWSQIFE